MHDKHMSYITINTAKSVISTFVVSQEKNTPIGNSELVKRFMKGLIVLNSPRSRYTAIWDVKIVLDYLSLLKNVRKFDLKMLTSKLTMLLCLVTAHRLQKLHLLQLSNMFSEGQNIIFTISDLMKQSSVRIKAPIIKLRPYADEALCVTIDLHEYLSRTKDLRKQVDNVFISYARPHLAVTKNTISQWIKSMLETAGIDINLQIA